jgi:DNA-binding NarL/FixJ family response regulator
LSGRLSGLWSGLLTGRDPRRIEHCILGPLLPAGGMLMAGIALDAAPRRRRAFSPRDRLLVSLLHGELGWVYQPDLALVSPDSLELTPRQQQTLHSLLAGLGEKQIARQMSLSRNTVHHHVKAVYKHFRVSSRSELLARWVRE